MPSKGPIIVVIFLCAIGLTVSFYSRLFVYDSSPVEEIRYFRNSTVYDISGIPEFSTEPNPSLSIKQTDSYLPQTPLQESTDTLRIFHTYHRFKPDAEFGTLPGLFTSFLLTQNLSSSKLVVWMEEGQPWLDFDKSVLQDVVRLYRTSEHIEFRLIDPQNLAEGSCFAIRPEFADKEIREIIGVEQYSDILRILLLRKYGGIWIDSDTMFLLDMSPLIDLCADQVCASIATSKTFPLEELEKRDKSDFLNTTIIPQTFNNNLIINQNKNSREIFYETACRFRRNVVQEKGRYQISPIYARSKYGQITPSYPQWIYNDGTIRLCFIEEDCPLGLLPVALSDPTFGKNSISLLTLCESFDVERLETKETVFHFDFRSNLQVDRFALSSGDHSLVSSLYFNKNSHIKENQFLLHTRAKKCRTHGGYGLLKYFMDKARAMVSYYTDVVQTGVPKYPVNFFVFDANDYPFPAYRTEFIKFTVFYYMEFSDFVLRQEIRQASDMSRWQGNMFKTTDENLKVFFFVTSPDDNLDFQNLFLENHLYEDIIVVDSDYPKPSWESLLQEKPGDLSHGYLPKGMIRGFLKFLNRYETHFSLFVFNKNTVTNFPLVTGVFEKTSHQKPHELLRAGKKFDHVLVSSLNENQTPWFGSGLNYGSAGFLLASRNLAKELTGSEWKSNVWNYTYTTNLKNLLPESRLVPLKFESKKDKPVKVENLKDYGFNTVEAKNFNSTDSKTFLVHHVNDISIRYSMSDFFTKNKRES